jgi:hypothetical protein
MFIALYLSQPVRAASDLFKSWTFTDPTQYNYSGGIETSGSTARLKAMNYTSDGDTSALYHFDEAAGPTAVDSSSNANNGTIVNGTLGSGDLNNSLHLNGKDSYVSTPDSASLSLSQTNSIEAWTKFNSPLSAGSHDQKQGVVDKGSYRLYYDQETGKLTYELESANSPTWSRVTNGSADGSWDINGKPVINAQVNIGDDLYTGMGNKTGDAEVWHWSGTSWDKIGGDGVNNSWPDQTYENVLSLANEGNTLYAGLGTTTGDGEVWSCNTGTGCKSWIKIGGDGVNNSWPINKIEGVYSMTVLDGKLYAGLGSSANDAQIWQWDGSSWTQVGGYGTPGPYNSLPSGYEIVNTLTTDGTSVYAGFGATAGDADIWKLSGTTWTQVGGDGLSSSWPASTYEYVLSLRSFGGKLYAGLGTTANDAEVWSYNGSSWTKIGGDSVNSSWGAGYEGVYSLAYDGSNVYAGLGLTAGDDEVWKWDGSAWTQIGGDGLNSGFTSSQTIVQAMTYANGTLYAGLQASANDAQEWIWDGSSWTQIGGGYLNSSWGYYGLQDITSMTKSGDYLYAGTGYASAGNAMVWRYDNNSWSLVGGQGINHSWPYNTYEDVTSMISFGGSLYVGLGTSAGDGDIWRLTGNTWTQIGGDGMGWAANKIEKVDSMAVLGSNLYVGLGTSANDAQVWRWDGTSWTQVGGYGISSPYNAFPNGYEDVLSMAVYGGNLVVGMGRSGGDADVWILNGTSWTQIGGDGQNSGWAASTYEDVDSLIPYNGKLYAGLGTTAGDAEVWEWNGTSWTQIGGDGMGWTDSQYEQVKSMVTYDGKLYVGLGNTAGHGEVWSYDNGTWQLVGGSGANNSWPVNTIEVVQSFSVYHGKLYAGLGNSTSIDAQVWSYGNDGFLQSSISSQDTAWHHVAATYDGSTMKIYIDGQLTASKNVVIPLADTDQPLLIGSTFGTSESGWSQGYFNGQIDEVRISDIARTKFTTKPFSPDAETITLKNPIWTSGVWHFDNVSDEESAAGGSITYRVSDNAGSTWKYWDGSAWVTSTDTSDANDINTLATNITTLPTTYNGLEWQAILKGDGTQQVVLNKVNASATSDQIAPSANASAITAEKTHGGSALASGNWTNSSAPYFSWTAGQDGQSGINGYCIYLGTDDTADPVTTKGMLGASPAPTGGRCQFEVTGSQLDLATSGYLAQAFTTSDSPYYLRIKAIDQAGNLTTGAAQFDFKFDNTAPTNPGYISGPSGFINTKRVTLTWATSGPGAPLDDNSGLAGLQYKINDSPWYGASHTGNGDMNDLLANNGSYSTISTPDDSHLVEGVNTLYFRTWDNAGNVTTTYVTAALKINTSGAPSEPLSLTASPASAAINSFAFNWDAPAVYVGDAHNIQYCYTINTLPSASTCTFLGAGTTSLGAGPYATQPGTNTAYVVAKDESGNINYASYSSVDFSANTPAPGIPLNVDIVDVSIKSTSNWRLALTWDVPTDTGAGISSYKIYRSTDGSHFTPIGSSSSTTYIDASLSQRTYYYYVRACDSTNNCGAPSSSVNDLPTGKFTAPANIVAPPVVSDITTRKAVITWSTDRASDSKIALGTESGKYSPSEIANSDQVSAHQIELDNLSAGTSYYFVAKWTDTDGNTGSTQEYTFTTAPPPSLGEVNAINVGLSSATIQFTSENSTKVAVYYGPTAAFGGVKVVNTSTSKSTYSIPLDGLTDGTKYLYKLVTYDPDGNTYDGNTASFTTPPRPHIQNLRFQPVSGQPTSTQEVTWTTNIMTDTSVTYGIVGTVGTTIQVNDMTTSHSITISSLVDNSEYFLTAQSRDQNGNVATSDRQQFHTALDTRPPVITNITVQPSIRGTGASARGQVVVSWSTDEPATSQVAYAEGASMSASQTTAEDGSLTFEHVVIVSNLPTSKVYSLVPISKDKAGNVAHGGTATAVVGQSSDDVMTVVLNTLRKVFGF